ncbi:hypothetical protein NDU88_003268 [Pleurodeles waltl]|uniref:Uncharacterized protein n=1 Tax=Pleurodeles waltl TaxID=8319 RepID=A0AAV7RCN0_PLEWA|nr:hypothetical protein NDU88_003268 [Pleurodeles waltl]
MPYRSCRGPGWEVAAETYGPVEGVLLRTHADGTRLGEMRYRCAEKPGNICTIYYVPSHFPVSLLEAFDGILQLSGDSPVQP